MEPSLHYENDDAYEAWREREEDAWPVQGDGRRCPHHPHVVIGSSDGLHDGVCGACEYECEMWPERMAFAVESFAYAMAGEPAPWVVLGPELPAGGAGDESDIPF